MPACPLLLNKISSMQLAMNIIWIISCLWLLNFQFGSFEGLKKMLVFEVILWANGKRTRLHFWVRGSSNCVKQTEKKNYFPMGPHTFSRLGRPAPKFRQTCTITQKQLIFRHFKCDFWIRRAKNLACTNI